MRNTYVYLQAVGHHRTSYPAEGRWLSWHDRTRGWFARPNTVTRLSTNRT